MVCGVWTWPLHQIVSTVDAPGVGNMAICTGPGPSLGAVLGVYYNRLRMAIPYRFVECEHVIS